MEKSVKKVYVKPQDDLNKVFESLTPGTTVHLDEGRYYGKFMINTPNVTIIGKGKNKTVIANDDYARMPDTSGNEIGTFKTYTLAVTADGVTLKNLTVENCAGSPEVKGQQVALSVVGSKFTATACRLTSTQDTLFLGPLPDDLVVRYSETLDNKLRYYEGEAFQKFNACEIKGSVDFIFGCGNALFDNCDIVSVGDGREVGYIAAPAHPLAATVGFVFKNCCMLQNDAKTVYLARPWRDFGKATFIECVYGPHICADGFSNWNDTARDKTARFYEYNDLTMRRVSWAKRLSRFDAEKLLHDIGPLFDF